MRVKRLRTIDLELCGTCHKFKPSEEFADHDACDECRYRERNPRYGGRTHRTLPDESYKYAGGGQGETNKYTCVGIEGVDK